MRDTKAVWQLAAVEVSHAAAHHFAKSEPIRVDMRRACAFASHVSRTIQIRNVPVEVHRKLKMRAAQEGVTLSKLLAREARRLAEQPTLEEIWERLLSRPKAKFSVSPARVIRGERDRR